MTLLKRDTGTPQAWQGELPVTSRYTYGLAGERFFRAIKDEGRIMGSVCPKCQITYVPARVFCERCLGGLDEWVDAGAQGDVHTFTVMHVAYDGSPLETPEILAFISLGDGGLVHRLGEVEAEDVFIGLLVEAVFKPQEERQGSITDVLYFRPY